MYRYLGIYIEKNDKPLRRFLLFSGYLYVVYCCTFLALYDIVTEQKVSEKSVSIKVIKSIYGHPVLRGLEKTVL